MQEKNNLVEEALIQMKNVEQAIAENAKGILQSTMKEEISQLVKESLTEQDDEEIDVDFETEEMPDDSDEMYQDDMETMDFGSEDDEDEESPIDLTGASDEEILKVFKAMGEDDGIIVKKDDEDIHLTDTDSNNEYLIKLQESEYEMEESEYEMDEADDMEVKKTIAKIFSEKYTDESSDMDEVMYEIEFDDEEEDEFEFDDEEDEEDDEDEFDYEEEDDEDEFEFDDEEEDDEEYESVGMYEMETEEGDDVKESYNPKRAKVRESKMSVKPKGLVGKGPKKVNFKSNTEGGFEEDKDEAFKGKVKAVGTGSAKKDVFKKGENMEGKPKTIKKAETKEAARTLGNGKYFRKGGLPKPRAHSEFNANIKESTENEVQMLREKNQEYRNALNVFREKLNEVAVFNSNLAYATRLFTEHSTTKKEKLNILRRFDNVETLRESKSLYRSIKDELNKSEAKPISETVENNINRSVSTGSSTTLIESKTYENPQFLRMKDLMSKIK